MGAHARGPGALRLVWVYPDLLSTYGDRGNLLVLERRARLRGIGVEAIQVNSDQPVPRQGDIYLLGGGEDLPQVLAARRLGADGGLAAAAAQGSVVFAVCAGYQLVGAEFGGARGQPVGGLEILDIRSGRGDRRGVGEILADVDPALGLPRLSGFENHQGVTRIAPGARPPRGPQPGPGRPVAGLGGRQAAAAGRRVRGVDHPVPRAAAGRRARRLGQYTSACAPSAMTSATNVDAPAMRTPLITSSGAISRRAAHCVHSDTVPSARTVASRSARGGACGRAKSPARPGSENQDASPVSHSDTGTPLTVAAAATLKAWLHRSGSSLPAVILMTRLRAVMLAL